MKISDPDISKFEFFIDFAFRCVQNFKDFHGFSNFQDFQAFKWRVLRPGARENRRLHLIENLAPDLMCQNHAYNRTIANFQILQSPYHELPRALARVSCTFRVGAH